MLYLLLFSVSLALVFSTKINTDNTLKLIGIGFIAVGALASYDKSPSVLIVIGAVLYILSELIVAHFGKHKRRSYDKVNG
jgi:lipoprotein signal peptidase